MACNTRICGPCDRDGEERNALSWCETCSECLCQNCLKEHKKNRASSSHKVILVEDLTNEFESVHLLNDLCDKHDSKIISLYCVSHDQLCCSACLHADHRQCAEVVTIEDVAKGSTKSTSFDDLEARIEDTYYILDTILKKKTENINGLEAQVKMCETDILIKKTTIMDQFEKAAMSAREEMKNKQESCVIKLFEETDNIKKTQSNIKSLQRDLKTLKLIGSNKNVFITVKKLDFMQHNLEQKLHNSREELLKKYELMCPPKSSFKSFESLFGESTIETSVMEGVPEFKKQQQCQTLREDVLQLVDTINPNSMFESFKAWKLCYFELHDKVAITSNNHVCVVNIHSKKVEKIDLTTLGHPWYIDKYDEDHALVTLSKNGSVFKINVVELKIIGKIDLDWDCSISSEVICVNDHIVIRDKTDQHFVILKKARVLRKLPIPFEQQTGYLCGYKENEIIYSDYYASNIYCVTLEGQKVFLTPVDCPTGIAVDKNNFIYVASHRNGIKKLTPDGKIIKTVLSYDGVILGMTYKKSTHELIIISHEGLQFYKIT